MNVRAERLPAVVVPCSPHHNERQKCTTFRARSIGCIIQWYTQGSMTNLYLWACERLYHELAPVYDTVSRLVSVGGGRTGGGWP